MAQLFFFRDELGLQLSALKNELGYYQTLDFSFGARMNLNITGLKISILALKNELGYYWTQDFSFGGRTWTPDFGFEAKNKRAITKIVRSH
ncbi:unnamed protein product [Rhizophagus irregularis]|nr:unnamed protein product [Rhizophagus irregularis]